MNNRFSPMPLIRISTHVIYALLVTTSTMGTLETSEDPLTKSPASAARLTGTWLHRRQVIQIPANLGVGAAFADWAVAAVTAGIDIGFFVGTSFTRRRIITSILAKNQICGSQCGGTVRIRKRRKQWLT